MQIRFDIRICDYLNATKHPDANDYIVKSDLNLDHFCNDSSKGLVSLLEISNNKSYYLATDK